MTEVLLRFAALACLASVKPAADPFSRLGDQLTILGIQLHRDTLSDVQKRLGRADARHNGGDGAASATAVCYVGPDGTVLALISVSEMGQGRYLVTDFHLATNEALVIYAPAAPEYAVQPPGRPTCAPLPSLSKATSTAGELRLGMTAGDVKRVMGEPSEATAERIVYRARRDSASGVRSVRLQLARGIVVGILSELDVL